MTDRSALDRAAWILWRDYGADGWQPEPFDSFDAAQREVANNGHGTVRITAGFAWPPREIESPLARQCEAEAARERAFIRARGLRSYFPTFAHWTDERRNGLWPQPTETGATFPEPIKDGAE